MVNYFFIPTGLEKFYRNILFFWVNSNFYQYIFYVQLMIILTKMFFSARLMKFSHSIEKLKFCKKLLISAGLEKIYIKLI